MSASEIAHAFLDPRGRCDRQGLLLIAIVLLVLQLVLGGALWLADVDLTGTVALALKAVFLWAAVAAASKRLHDFGRSAWWLLGGLAASVAWSFALAFAAIFTVGPEALTPQSPWFAAFFAGTSLPLFAALMWLHFAKGMQGPNRFGPATNAWGFAGPAPDGSLSPLTLGPGAAINT